MFLSDDYANIALDQITVGGTADPPATRYWGLRYNGTEVSASGSAYARVASTSATAWEAASYLDAHFARTNVDEVDFGTPTAVWGYVNELCLYDGISDPDPAMMFDLTESGGALYIDNGAEFKILPGEIILYIYTGDS